MAIVWRFVRRRKKKISPLQPLPAPAPLPAHLTALADLQALREKNLLQEGKTKSYYSQLSRILRTYIANRWQVRAMEMVSQEIADALQAEDIPTQERERLNGILRCADWVKFAKGNPSLEESLQRINEAETFVRQTAQQKTTL
jgi:hypothetical protein